MAISECPQPTFLHTDQIDIPELNSTQLKQGFDSQALGIIDYINNTLLTYIQNLKKCFVETTGTQVIPTSDVPLVYTKISFDKVNYDSSSMLSSGSVKIKETGWYDIHAYVKCNSNANGGLRQIGIYKNLTYIPRMFQSAIEQSYPVNLTISTMQYLQLNDIIDVMLTQDSGYDVYASAGIIVSKRIG